MRLSVFSTSDLQSVILAMRGLDKELAKVIRRETKSVLQPIWQEVVRGNVHDRQQSVVLSQTARTAISNQNVTLTSATIGKPLSGGARPSELAHSVEFGADRNYRRSYQSRSSKGTPYKVHNRRTRSQFLPRNLKGYTVYPAAADAIPRIAALWVQTTVRTFIESFERR